jgi:hypothetical protein
MKLKKIPYGLSDYKLIKSENYYFVDKTKYIGELTFLKVVLTNWGGIL